MTTIAIAAAAWLVPVAAFAVSIPAPDAPFFGWLAVPVVAVVGHKVLKNRKEKDRDSL